MMRCIAWRSSGGRRVSGSGWPNRRETVFCSIPWGKSFVVIGCPFHYHSGCAVCFPFFVLYDTTTSGGNTHIHIAAAPQIVLLYKFVCVLRALARTQNTHKLVLQRVVAAGGPPILCYPHPPVMNCLLAINQPGGESGTDRP